MKKNFWLASGTILLLLCISGTFLLHEAQAAPPPGYGPHPPPPGYGPPQPGPGYGPPPPPGPAYGPPPPPPPGPVYGPPPPPTGFFPVHERISFFDGRYYVFGRDRVWYRSRDAAGPWHPIPAYEVPRPVRRSLFHPRRPRW
jgi:hypothetical protein